MEGGEAALEEEKNKFWEEKREFFFFEKGKFVAGWERELRSSKYSRWC